MLCYQHRDTEPSFTLRVRENHIITIKCKLFPVEPYYRFGLTLHAISTYNHTHTHIPHVLQLHFTPGARNPFAHCEFAWEGSDV